jgi:hypothetical protein
MPPSRVVTDRWFAALAAVVALGSVGYGVVASAAPPPAPPPPPPPSPVTPAPVPDPTPAALAKPLPTPSKDGADLEWSKLTTYEYKPGLASLPDAIRALDGTRVSMRGFLMPIYEFDDIHEFSLVASHMSCCFGVPAGLNGQVYVKVAGKRGLPNTNEPLRVVGTFRAKEIKEAGYVLAIYAIEDADVRIEGY